jgi:WD40 repeat protein
LAWDFTADGTHLVLYNYRDPDSAFRLWEIASGRESPGNGLACRGLFSFLKGGKEVVVCRDGALHFHDMTSGKPLRRIDLGPGLEGEQGRAGAISPDGRLFLVPATDGSLRLWDLAAARELPRLPDPGGKGYRNPTFSPDGRHAAVGCVGAVIVFRLPEPTPAEGKP